MEINHDLIEQYRQADKVAEKVKQATKHVPQNYKVPILYGILEEHIIKMKLPEATACGQGCSFCCHDRILITPQEADYIKTQKYEFNQERKKLQDETKDFWSLKFADRACIFLKDGKCTVYQTRPLVCRNHNVGKEAIPEIDCIVENGKTATVNQHLSTELTKAIDIVVYENLDVKEIYKYF